MIRTVRFSVIFCFILFLPLSSFGAETIQLTDHEFNYYSPQDINAGGQAVWIGTNSLVEGGDSQLFFYDGQDTRNLTSSLFQEPYLYTFPQISDSGLAVWSGNPIFDSSSHSEIFFFDGSTARQFTTTDNVRDGSAQISNDGSIVWRHGNGDILFSSMQSDPTNLTSDDIVWAGLPAISNGGHIVWAQSSSSNPGALDAWRVSLLDQGVTKEIAQSDTVGVPTVNANGQAAWIGTSQSDTGLRVMFYDGQETRELADLPTPKLVDGSTAPKSDLNDLGQIVWNYNGNVYLYDGRLTQQLTNGESLNAYAWPDINAKGEVVWSNFDQSKAEDNIFLYDGTNIRPLGVGRGHISYPRIADNGNVVWLGTDGNVFLYKADAGSSPPPEDAILLNNETHRQTIESAESLANRPKNQLIDAVHGDYGENALDSEKKTIVIVHGTNETKDSEWVKNMVGALEQRLGPETYNIAIWDWTAGANTTKNSDPSTNWIPFMTETNGWVMNSAIIQGNDLAGALYGAGYDYTKELHLIGFSAGGTVIDQAAKELRVLGGNVGQLTFLDSPNFYKGTTDFSLGTLISTPFDATTADWADNHRSAIGSFDINGAYDYYLNVPTHEYAHDFYTETIRAPQNGDFLKADVGFFWSREGGGWDEHPNRNSFGGETSDFVNDVQETVTRVVNGSITTVKVSTEKTYADLHKSIEDTIYTVDTKLQETFDTAGNWAGEGNVYFQNSVAKLFEGSPAYLFEELTIPEDTNFATFDFKFNDPGDGDYLAAYFDDDLLFWYKGDNFYGDEFWNSGLLNVSEYAGKSGTWTFALNSVGQRNAEIWLDNLTFYNIQADHTFTNIPSAPVPEPSTFALLSLGVLGGVFVRKRNIKSIS